MSNEMIPLSEVKELAKAAAASNFFPGVRTPEAALVLMALAQAEGLPPIVAMMRYDVIDGKPSKKATAMLTDFLAAGGKVEWHRHDDHVADATFSHPVGGSVRVHWDLEKARAAGLSEKANWKKHPGSMLHARCVSNGVRFVYPAASGGMYEPSEVADYEMGPEAKQKPKTGAAKLAEFMAEPAPKATEPLGGAAVVDAEYEEPPPPADVTPTPMPLEESEEQRKARGGAAAQEALAKALDGKKLQIPDLTTDRVPPDVMALSRKLIALPFAEQTGEMLAKQVGVLQKMADACKDGDNRAVLALVAAVAKSALDRKAAPQ